MRMLKLINGISIMHSHSLDWFLVKVPQCTWKTSRITFGIRQSNFMTCLGGSIYEGQPNLYCTNNIWFDALWDWNLSDTAFCFKLWAKCAWFVVKEIVKQSFIWHLESKAKVIDACPLLIPLTFNYIGKKHGNIHVFQFYMRHCTQYMWPSPSSINQ